MPLRRRSPTVSWVRPRPESQPTIVRARDGRKGSSDRQLLHTRLSIGDLRAAARHHHRTALQHGEVWHQPYCSVPWANADEIALEMR